MKTKLVLLFFSTIVGSCCGQVAAPHSTVDGKTIGEWTVDWAHWAFPQSTNQSPLFDTDGSRATNGQSGLPVFFVEGGYYTGGQVRQYEVPEGAYLLVPVLTVEVDNIDTVPPLTVQELRDVAAVLIGTPDELHASINGTAVQNVLDHREPSPVFSFELPTADNPFSVFYGHPIVGVIDPAVFDGYWLMFEPLPPGTNSLHFGGSYSSPISYSFDRTDRIIVVPMTVSALLEQLRHLVISSDLAENRQQPLLASLNAAKASFDSGNPTAAINQLHAFDNKVSAQVAPQDATLANDLTQAVERILERSKAGIME